MKRSSHSNRRKLICRTAAACLFIVTTAAGAQSYPDKPIRVIVPFTAGGGLSRQPSDESFPVRRLEERSARHERIGPSLPATTARLGVHATVHFQAEVEAARSPFGREEADVVEDCRDEGLSTEAWKDGHAEDEVHRVEVR